MGFPGGSVVKNPPTNAGDLGSMSRSERSLGAGNGKTPQYSSWGISWTEEPGEIQSMGLQELDTTSQLNNNILTYSSFFLLLAISLLKYFLDTSSLIFMALSI